MNHIRRLVAGLTVTVLTVILCVIAAAPAASANSYPYPNAPDCTEVGSNAGCVPDKWNFYQGQCTSWVSWKLNAFNGVDFDNWYMGVRWSNASNWDNAARSVGIRVDQTPALGAVAQWDTINHVAYVERVVSNNEIVISDMNFDLHNGVRSSVTLRRGQAGWPENFIHIKDRAGSTAPTEDYAYANPRVEWLNGVDSSNLAPNSLYHVRVSVDITGSKPWSNQDPNPVRLGIRDDSNSPIAYVDRSKPGSWLDARRINVDQIDTSTTATWSFAIRTPRTTGGFTETFRVVVEHLKWLDSSPQIRLSGTVEQPAAKPSAPGNVSARPGVESATVSWSAAAGNGAPIMGYAVEARPGGKRCSTGAGGRSCTVQGLTGDATYSFVVTATNSAGSASASTSSVTVDRKVVIDPTVTRAAATGPSGTRFDGSGSGFTPNGTVQVHAVLPDGSAYPAGNYQRSFAARGDGTFSWQWRFGNPVETGVHTITFTDAATGRSAAVRLTATAAVEPSLRINPGTVSVGTAAAVIGEGFGVNERVGISVYNPAGEAVHTSVNTVAFNGAFSRAWTPDQPGTWLVVATGSSSSLALEATIRVTSGECLGATYTALGNSGFAGMEGREGSLVRLYSAVFLRLPDQGGFEYWLGQPLSLRDMAQHFVASAEFESRYGTVTDRDFVALLYCNVLGRQPDQGGYDYWVNVLETKPRYSVVIEFSESAEYRIRTGTS